MKYMFLMKFMNNYQKKKLKMFPTITKKICIIHIIFTSSWLLFFYEVS